MTFLRSAGLPAAALAASLLAATATTTPAAVGGAPVATAAAMASKARPGAPRITSMIVGKDGIVGGVRTVTAARATVRVGGRRCRVAAGTPLAVLVARGTSIRLRDHGRCGRRAVDAGGLYVRQIGADRERGQAGWVYKVGHRTGTTGAADPSGPFGTGRRLRAGQPLLWFWCRTAGRCQRTLSIDAPARVHPNRAFTITVRGYDDQGRGVPVAGVSLRVGANTFETDAHGRATVRATAAGRLTLRAAKAGLVDAFPRTVSVR